MKEQWKKLDSDAKLLLNVEEGRAVPIKIELPISALASSKPDCCRRLITTLRVSVLLLALLLLGWTAKTLYTNYYYNSGSLKPLYDEPLVNSAENLQAFRQKVYEQDSLNKDNHESNDAEVTTESSNEISLEELKVFSTTESISENTESKVERSGEQEMKLYFQQQMRTIEPVAEDDSVDEEKKANEEKSGEQVQNWYIIGPIGFANSANNAKVTTESSNEISLEELKVFSTTESIPENTESKVERDGEQEIKLYFQQQMRTIEPVAEDDSVEEEKKADEEKSGEQVRTWHFEPIVLNNSADDEKIFKKMFDQFLHDINTQNLNNIENVNDVSAYVAPESDRIPEPEVQLDDLEKEVEKEIEEEVNNVLEEIIQTAAMAFFDEITKDDSNSDESTSNSQESKKDLYEDENSHENSVNNEETSENKSQEPLEEVSKETETEVQQQGDIENKSTYEEKDIEEKETSSQEKQEDQENSWVNPNEEVEDISKEKVAQLEQQGEIDDKSTYEDKNIEDKETSSQEKQEDQENSWVNPNDEVGYVSTERTTESGQQENGGIRKIEPENVIVIRKIEPEDVIAIIARRVEPIVGENYQLLLWYLANKDRPMFELVNDQLKVYTAKMLYSTNVREYGNVTVTLLDLIHDDSYDKEFAKLLDPESEKVKPETDVQREIVFRMLEKSSMFRKLYEGASSFEESMFSELLQAYNDIDEKKALQSIYKNEEDNKSVKELTTYASIIEDADSQFNKEESEIVEESNDSAVTDDSWPSVLQAMREVGNFNDESESIIHLEHTARPMRSHYNEEDILGTSDPFLSENQEPMYAFPPSAPYLRDLLQQVVSNNAWESENKVSEENLEDQENQNVQEYLGEENEDAFEAHVEQQEELKETDSEKSKEIITEASSQPLFSDELNERMDNHYRDILKALRNDNIPPTLDVSEEDYYSSVLSFIHKKKEGQKNYFVGIHEILEAIEEFQKSRQAINDNEKNLETEENQEVEEHDENQENRNDQSIQENQEQPSMNEFFTYGGDEYDY